MWTVSYVAYTVIRRKIVFMCSAVYTVITRKIGFMYTASYPADIVKTAEFSLSALVVMLLIQ